MENLVQFVRVTREAIAAVHNCGNPRPPKPKNIPDPDWLPKEWTPEDVEAEDDEGDEPV
jgi:hypothetical protein